MILCAPAYGVKGFPMALTDYFKEADVLASMSWTAIPFKAQVARLANLYLRKEGEIRRIHRNYEGATAGTVRLFIKSLYTPPHGLGKATTDAVRKALPWQRKIRKKREDNPPWVWKKARRPRDRWNAVARHRYSIWEKNYKGKQEKVAPNVVGLGRIGDVTVIVEGGSYSVKTRVYLRDNVTKAEKVVMLRGDRLKSITQAMLRMAPKAALRGMFSGAPIRLDVAEEAFEVEGKLVSWRNVYEIYSGRKVHKTRHRPQD